MENFILYLRNRFSTQSSKDGKTAEAVEYQQLQCKVETSMQAVNRYPQHFQVTLSSSYGNETSETQMSPPLDELFNTRDLSRVHQSLYHVTFAFHFCQ